MPESRLEHLLNSYVHNDITTAEEEELMGLLAQTENESDVKEIIDRVIKHTGAEAQMGAPVSKAILQSILQKDKGNIVPITSRKTVSISWAAAAVIVLLTGIAAYWVLTGKQDGKAKLAAAVKKENPIMPGGNKAILTTSAGNTIVLDTAKNGALMQTGATRISKQNGLLVYNAGSAQHAGIPVTYNTLATPRGGQYRLLLPDGTKVWLNAASSLYFPSAFEGDNRQVVLTGEAYFEVTRNKEKPFIVMAGGIRVNVLGTHFNINAYPEEKAVKTTLLEGSVRISKGDITGLLKPGQQGVLDNDKTGVTVSNADIEEVMAWKNGLFQFDGADITTVMEEIGRWYDVDVEYPGKIPMHRFQGKISREAQLSDVLKILELSNVKFTVTGKKIIVQ